MRKAQGYYTNGEFYHPDEIDLSSPSPASPHLLQRKPAALTDENGVAEITFAASDVNTEFVGLVEAVNGTSSVGAQTFVFRVIKQ